MVLYRKSLRGILILSYFPASNLFGSRLKFVYLFFFNLKMILGQGTHDIDASDCWGGAGVVSRPCN
jgi:hypothetical protein